MENRDQNKRCQKEPNLAQREPTLSPKPIQNCQKGPKGCQRGSKKANKSGKMTCQKSMLNFDAEKVEKDDKCHAPGPGVAVWGGPFYYV